MTNLQVILVEAIVDARITHYGWEPTDQVFTEQKRRAEKDVCYLSDAECEEFLQAENFISNRFINNSV